MEGVSDDEACQQFVEQGVEVSALGPTQDVGGKAVDDQSRQRQD